MTKGNVIICIINSMSLEISLCFGIIKKGFLMEAEIESCPENWTGIILIDSIMNWLYKFVAWHEQKCRDGIRKISASMEHILSAFMKSCYWDGLGDLKAVSVLTYSRFD